MNTLVLLPGMDGTGRLFKPLRDSLPEEMNVMTVSYPREEPLGYSDLLTLVRRSLPRDPFVLVAESFSGPIGIELAAAHQRGAQG